MLHTKATTTSILGFVYCQNHYSQNQCVCVCVKGGGGPTKFMIVLLLKSLILPLWETSVAQVEHSDHMLLLFIYWDLKESMSEREKAYWVCCNNRLTVSLTISCVSATLYYAIVSKSIGLYILQFEFLFHPKILLLAVILKQKLLWPLLYLL